MFDIFCRKKRRTEEKFEQRPFYMGAAQNTSPTPNRATVMYWMAADKPVLRDQFSVLIKCEVAAFRALELCECRLIYYKCNWAAAPRYY